MNQYRINFTGRQKDAIGMIHFCTDVSSGYTEEEAILNLYDYWEHISPTTIIKLPEGKFHTPGCDGGNCLQNEPTQIRSLPTGHGNALLCFACYRHEMCFRKSDKLTDLPTWEDLKIYEQL